VFYDSSYKQCYGFETKATSLFTVDYLMNIFCQVKKIYILGKKSESEIYQWKL